MNITIALATSTTTATRQQLLAHRYDHHRAAIVAAAARMYETYQDALAEDDHMSIAAERNGAATC